MNLLFKFFIKISNYDKSTWYSSHLIEFNEIDTASSNKNEANSKSKLEVNIIEFRSDAKIIVSV
jgi:hypothetical protein